MNEPRYKDLDLNFDNHPATKDVVRKYDDDAIKRSVRNLILTNYGEKPFRHDIGSNVRQLLFELVTPLSAIRLKDAIVEVIANHEPRAEVRKVEVLGNLDKNGYDVSIQYNIKNISQPFTVDLFLERLR